MPFSGSIPNVEGSRIEIVTAAPAPGIAPTTTPRIAPTHIVKKTEGSASC